MASQSNPNVKLVNTKVVCRIRPQNLSEKRCGGHTCLDYSNTAIEVYTSLGQYPFECDRIFDETASQADLFDYCAKPLVKDALLGINSTILAFGQTGSGKTYSIEGDFTDASSVGIVPRVVIALFDAAVDRADAIEFDFRISYIEIYMEKIKDLLADEGPSVQNVVKMVGVNVTERKLSSFEQFIKYWKAGTR